MTAGTHRTGWTLTVLLTCLAVSLICVVYPIYVVRPFRAQGERELAAALVVMRFRPVVTVISALCALLAAVGYWRAQPRKWQRILVIGGALFACLLAILVRVNVYELMFHPVDHPSFAAAARVKLDRDEKVIAVNIGGKARAYPIRSLSYHHVVNDVVDSSAIVATY
jgi:uncharacterized protein DUF3179